jgi:hypothetical protein
MLRTGSALRSAVGLYSSSLSCAGGSPVWRDVNTLCRVGRAERSASRTQSALTYIIRYVAFRCIIVDFDAAVITEAHQRFPPASRDL